MKSIIQTSPLSSCSACKGYGGAHGSVTGMCWRCGTRALTCVVVVAPTHTVTVIWAAK